VVRGLTTGRQVAQNGGTPAGAGQRGSHKVA
jgi:hypothetical protein